MTMTMMTVEAENETSQQVLLLSLVLASLPVSFLLSFAIGANDVANSFGTSYGSGVLTLRQCCILATIFESLGAVLLGYNVSETVRKGVFDVSLYEQQAPLLALGYFSALIGSALWNLLATLLKLPVSGTHSILGAVLGFHIVHTGFVGVKFLSLSGVVASWFVSPALAGLVSMVTWQLVVEPLTRRRVLLRRLLPTFYATCLAANAFSVLFRGPAFLSPAGLTTGHWLPALAYALGVSLVVGGVTYLCAYLWYSPRSVQCRAAAAARSKQRSRQSAAVAASDNKEGEEESAALSLSHSPGKSGTTNDEEGEESKEVEGGPETLFASLQVLTACLGSLAHGANDVSNAIGPLVALFLIHRDAGNVFQEGEPVPFYLFLFGGFGISCGVWALGRRVIETIGRDLSKKRLTPSVGFTVELASSLTVLVASKLGLPISTTHCKVGSVVSLAWLDRRRTTTSSSALDAPDAADAAQVDEVKGPETKEDDDDDCDYDEKEEDSAQLQQLKQRTTLVINSEGNASSSSSAAANVSSPQSDKKKKNKKVVLLLTTETPQPRRRPQDKGEEEGQEELEEETEVGGGVNWSLFGQIAAAWLLTVPVSGLVSGLAFYFLTLVFPAFSSSYYSSPSSSFAVDSADTPFY